MQLAALPSRRLVGGEFPQELVSFGGFPPGVGGFAVLNSTRSRCLKLKVSNFLGGIGDDTVDGRNPAPVDG